MAKKRLKTLDERTSELKARMKSIAMLERDEKRREEYEIEREAEILASSKGWARLRRKVVQGKIEALVDKEPGKRSLWKPQAQWEPKVPMDKAAKTRVIVDMTHKMRVRLVKYMVAQQNKVKIGQVIVKALDSWLTAQGY